MHYRDFAYKEFHIFILYSELIFVIAAFSESVQYSQVAAGAQHRKMLKLLMALQHTGS